MTLTVTPWCTHSEPAMGSLSRSILDFIHSPYPVWEPHISEQLFLHTCSDLVKKGYITSEDDYELAKVIIRDRPIEKALKEEIAHLGTKIIRLEFAIDSRLNDFYHEHDLNLLSQDDVLKLGGVKQFSQAFRVLEISPDCAKCISVLCKSVHFLKQLAPEYDTSYSHPDVPFTVFISISDETSATSTLRLAESLLHESMHLKLSLIEGHLDLIKQDSEQLFYSPWREELRPIRGVLHGMFVFKAILDFYMLLRIIYIGYPEQLDFVEWRIEKITSELKELNMFYLSEGLTSSGAILAKNLLP